MTPALRSLVHCVATFALVAALLAGALLLVANSADAEDAASGAYQEALAVARAVDGGAEAPEVAGCEEALERPSPAACEEYDVALEDFLADARESCEEGRSRAEDLSCVTAGFYGGKEDKS
jgi:hypothetical protein